jgi:hypothetical protein
VRFASRPVIFMPTHHSIPEPERRRRKRAYRDKWKRDMEAIREARARLEAESRAEVERRLPDYEELPIGAR